MTNARCYKTQRPNRPVDLNLTKCTKYMIGSHLLHHNKPLRNDHISSLDMPSQKNVHNYLKRLLKYSPTFQLYISLRLDFLHKLKPEQRITTDGMQKQIGNSRCLEKICKNVEQCLSKTFLKYSFFLKTCIYVNT